jgi:ABC-type Zn2+ transport system substrate-binding protein/surface adhesin
VVDLRLTFSVRVWQYFNMIRSWGDWTLFQELLATMGSIAEKHKVMMMMLPCFDDDDENDDDDDDDDDHDDDDDENDENDDDDDDDDTVYPLDDDAVFLVQVSIPNVAVRWVVEQPAVGGAIVGVRFGLKQHLDDTKAVFQFALDEDDRNRIATVNMRAKNLMEAIGDCGDEYRG